MAARSIGSGTISFGLVSIPIKLFTATSAKSVSFNMLHKTCGGRLKQQLLCPVDNVVVERSDTIRGFEYARDQYVKFTDEELKAMESARTGVLELQEFVPADTVGFLYIEKTCFIGPDKRGGAADSLLSQSLERNNKLAVGRFAHEWADRVKEAVDKKVAGEEISTAPEAPKAQIIDLLEALKRSVAAAEVTPANVVETPPPVVAKGPKKAEPRAVEEAPAKAKRKKSG